MKGWLILQDISRQLVSGHRASVNFEKDEAEAKKLKIYIDRLNEMLKKFSIFISEEKKQAI